MTKLNSKNLIVRDQGYTILNVMKIRREIKELSRKMIKSNPRLDVCRDITTQIEGALTQDFALSLEDSKFLSRQSDLIQTIVNMIYVFEDDLVDLNVNANLENDLIIQISEMIATLIVGYLPSKCTEGIGTYGDLAYNIEEMFYFFLQ